MASDAHDRRGGSGPGRPGLVPASVSFDAGLDLPVTGGRRKGAFERRAAPGPGAQAHRERLKEARKARREERQRDAALHREREGDEQARRRKSWARARHPVEPSIEGHDGQGATQRAGWVALVGRPNVGKSTLLNALLGQKLAATTHKPQTTRSNLLGILNPPGAQLLLVDTPGHHLPKGPLNRYMVAQAEEALRDADVIAWVTEARSDGRITPGNERLCERLTKAQVPVVVALNKVDRVPDKGRLLVHMEAIEQRLQDRLRSLVPISARRKTGLEELVRALALALPEGPPLVAAAELTDRSERDIAAEFIREKAILELQDELPYAVAVTVESFEDLRPRLVRIEATLHVERSSQKGIVIGRQGGRLKAIGVRARKDVEFFLGAKVYLALRVRVTDGWTEHPERLRELGYRTRRDQESSSPHMVVGEGVLEQLALAEGVLEHMTLEDDVPARVGLEDDVLEQETLEDGPMSKPLASASEACDEEDPE